MLHSELKSRDSNHLDDPFSEVDESHEAWSKYLNENYGRLTAASFAVGSDIVLEHAKEDLAELARLPKGTHMGELCGDADLEIWLYSKTFLVQAGHAYHFDSWLEEQFYLDR